MKNLSSHMKNELTKEIRFAVKQMEKASTPAEKLYFFSAIFGMASRVMNFEYDPELVFIHQVTQYAYNTINTRVGMIASGQELAISIPSDLFVKLEESLEELAFNIERDAHTYPALQKIANLTYSTTGNGYYLYLKGLLTI